MRDLKAIVGDKNYFVLTSNGECHFEMSGFAPENIYEIEGNWLTMQCSHACHDTLYPSLDMAEKMAAAEKNGKVPSDMIPHCPKCGGSMQIHFGSRPEFYSGTCGAGTLSDIPESISWQKAGSTGTWHRATESVDQSSAYAACGYGAKCNLCHRQSWRIIYYG